jgi:hypothetical protein
MLVGSSVSLSCYQCKRENLPDQENPRIYDYFDSLDGPLDLSCLDEAQRCSEEGDEWGDVKCVSVTLGSDHFNGGGAESIDAFYCMYLDHSYSEEEAQEEICGHAGAMVGSECKVTANCVEDGCNYDSDAPTPHACSSCELPAGDICQHDNFIDVVIQSDQCRLVNCTDGVNQCFTKIDEDSCKVTVGCKPPDLTDCPSSTCSVCDTEECTLDTPNLCEPGNGCVEESPHVCLSCTHPVCASLDPTEVCDYQNCSTGVKECYSQVDSCSITRGCKSPDFKCEDGSTTCSVCKEDEICHLDTNSLCKSGGDCDESLTCNSCVIDLTIADVCKSDFDWSQFADSNCEKEVTCSNGAENCAIVADVGKVFVGCSENRPKNDKEQSKFNSYQELMELLKGLYAKGFYNSCSDSSNTGSDPVSDTIDFRSSPVSVALTFFTLRLLVRA